MRAIEHIPHAFVTNNPTQTPAAVAQKLQRLDIACVAPDLIITSAVATAQWLARKKPGFRYFAVGADGLRQALEQVGQEDPGQADFVVVGEGPGIDFEAIAIGINLILQQNAELICTNPDSNVDAFRDGRHWILPGGGALVAPFAVATAVEPEFIGKPAAGLYLMALQRLGVSPEDALMIGDRPDTDIAGAQNLNMHTALVRTGRFAPGQALPEDILPPDWDVDTLQALLTGE